MNQRKPMKYFVSGLLMGLANLIPGVSGGTIAVLTGIYEDLVKAVSSLFSFKISRGHLYLLALVIGGTAIAIFAGSSGMEFLLHNHRFETYAIFFGLVMGSLPSLFRRLERVSSIPVLTGLAIVMIPQLLDVKASIGSSSIALATAGALAAGAMVLPGLSGSLILLILGTYDLVISAVSSLNFRILIPFGIGVLVGTVVFVKLIDFALERFRNWMTNFIVGLVVGSLYAVYPFGLKENGGVLLGLILIVCGSLITALIDRYGARRRA